MSFTFGTEHMWGHGTDIELDKNGGDNNSIVDMFLAVFGDIMSLRARISCSLE